MTRQMVAYLDSDGDNTAQAARVVGGTIDYLHVINPNAADAYLQLFDAATGSVTVGTTTPRQSYLVPANGAFEVKLGLHFNTAITYACTTTATGNGDPVVGLVVNMLIA